MNMLALPAMRTLIPESAPFTPEQKAWLNGFFEAVLSAGSSRSSLDRKSVV